MNDTPQPPYNEWQRDDELAAELIRERSIEDANDQRDETHDAEYREESARAARRMADMRDGGVEETGEEWLAAERRQDLIADGKEDKK